MSPRFSVNGLLVVVILVVCSCSGSSTTQTSSPESSPPTTASEETDLRVVIEVYGTVESANTIVRSDDPSEYSSLTAEELRAARVDVVERSTGRQCFWSESRLDGATVEIQNASQQIIGANTLRSPGKFGSKTGSADIFACNYQIEISDLPKSDFYRIVIDGDLAATFSHDELRVKDWDITLQIPD